MERDSKREYYKKYYRENQERIAVRNKLLYQKRRSTPDGVAEHRKISLEATRRYRLKNPEKVKQSRRQVYLGRKTRAMELLGGAECVGCGCDAIDFLEFNHINGGGVQEWRENSQPLVDRILSGKRTIDDLNVLCRVCNALDHLVRKNPDLARGFRVSYNNELPENWAETTPPFA